MEKWEYKVVSSNPDPESIYDECGPAGENGWELVSVIVVEATPGEMRTRMIFKRPLTD